MEHDVLITGDYWHRDFKAFLSEFDHVKLMPIKQVANSNETFDLIIIAQSRPGQYPLETVQQIQIKFPNSPIVSLSGSWCEGELRTGKPWPGVIRILWHQWLGQFERFMEQLNVNGVTDWHLPRTATPADRILQQHPPHTNPTTRHSKTDSNSTRNSLVGISARTHALFDMLRDVIESIGLECYWIERGDRNQQDLSCVDRICVDGDSLTPELEERIDRLQAQYPTAELVVFLNFPRIEDRQTLQTKGIRWLISKPFELADIKMALGSKSATNQPH